MLYIKFKILNPEKFTDFQTVYQHMLKVRTPGFDFKVNLDEVDWANITDEEEELLFDEDLQLKKRYNELFPDYANAFLERYFGGDNVDSSDNIEVFSILNYLEYGFEVDMNNLEQLDNHSGLVEFSTGNFPYGGMERFLMVLKAYDLVAVECFNGFTVYEFEWISEFEHNAIELSEKTIKYLNRIKP
ncbi:MAG: hypothetical protein C0598_12235 [Marinilabiliales bacterium]|nr:MAG: hypothetical protein C0598_12235 [Marinilabiliales bacterium]